MSIEEFHKSIRSLIGNQCNLDNIGLRWPNFLVLVMPVAPHSELEVNLGSRWRTREKVIQYVGNKGVKQFL